jgi:iron complex outermembrane receptor protein
MLACGGATLALLTSAGLASAQAAAGSPTVDTVTVTSTRAETATKTDTPLIETPQAISVVTSGQIRDQAVQTIDQALRYTAGVVAETRGGSATREDFQYVRGFGPFGINYLDGMKQPYASFGFFQNEAFFLDRIEVLKGPSSVLYGQNSPGGLVHLISKKPTAEARGELAISGGSFGRIEGDADLSGPLGDDGRLLYRLVAVARTGDTQVDHTKSERLAIAPSLTWRPDEATSLTVLGQYLHDPESGHFGYIPAQGSFLPNPNGRIPRGFFDGEPGFNHDRRTQASIGYEFDHRFAGDWSIHQSLRYAHLDSDLALAYGNALGTDLRTLARGAFTDRDKLGAFTVDNRLAGGFDTGPLHHALLVGVDYQHTRADARWLFGAAPPIDLFNPVYGQPITAPSLPLLDQKQTLDQTGVYLQDQVTAGRWVLLAGVRHDWADTETRSRSTGLATKVDDTAFTGRAGLVYRFDNGLAPYVSYSTSFLPTSGANWQGRPFEPTEGRQWEAGVKYQPKGVRSFVTASVFDLVQDNVQTPDPDPSHGPFAQVQSGRARARGIELEGHAELTPSLSLIAAYSHLDNKVIRSNGPDLGKRPVSVPRDTASAWADYQVRSGALRGLGVNAGVRRVGASFADVANAQRVPGYTAVDAGARYDLGRYRLALNAANLFDKRGVVCSNGYASCNYIQARTITASLRYRW